MTTTVKEYTHLLFTLSVGVALLATPLTPVLAHNGEDHGDSTADTHVEVTRMSTAEMEQMIVLLRQLIALIVEQKRVAALVPASVHVDSHAEMHSEEAHHEEEEHHEDTAVAEKKLVIEVEEHFGKTHVHVRYTDKPEVMMYVEAPLTDEAALIAAIVAKTGLSSDEVKAALKYM